MFQGGTFFKLRLIFWTKSVCKDLVQTKMRRDQTFGDKQEVQLVHLLGTNMVHFCVVSEF